VKTKYNWLLGTRTSEKFTSNWVYLYIKVILDCDLQISWWESWAALLLLSLW